MRRFGLLATGLSFVLIVSGHWLKDPLDLHSFYNLLVLFFLGQSLIIGWLIGIANRQQSDQTPLIIMGIIGFRMITGLFLLLIFYFFKIPDLVTFVSSFSCSI